MQVQILFWALYSIIVVLIADDPQNLFPDIYVLFRKPGPVGVIAGDMAGKFGMKFPNYPAGSWGHNYDSGGQG